MALRAFIFFLLALSFSPTAGRGSEDELGIQGGEGGNPGLGSNQNIPPLLGGLLPGVRPGEFLDRARGRGNIMQNWTAAWDYMRNKYHEENFTVGQVTRMAAAQRNALARAITDNEVIFSNRGLHAFLMANQSWNLTLAGRSESDLNETLINIGNWGNSSRKATFLSYFANATGFTLMGLPPPSLNAFQFLFAVDRMDNDGNLTNNETFEFTVTCPGVAQLTVLTYNSSFLDGIDVLLDGGIVQALGDGRFKIRVRHTSAFSGMAVQTASSDGGNATSGNTTSGGQAPVGPGTGGNPGNQNGNGNGNGNGNENEHEHISAPGSGNGNGRGNFLDRARNQSKGHVMANWTEAWNYMKDKYHTENETIGSVTRLAAQQRNQLAKSILDDEFIYSNRGVHAFLLANRTQNITLAGRSDNDANDTEVEIGSWGNASRKATFLSYFANATGFGLMGLNVSNPNAFQFLFAVDRMDNDGNITNGEPFSFTILVPGVAQIKVFTYNETFPSGLDVLLDGGSVVPLGDGRFKVNVRHTSAFTGQSVTASSSGDSSPSPVSDSPEPVEPDASPAQSPSPKAAPAQSPSPKAAPAQSPSPKAAPAQSPSPKVGSSPSPASTSGAMGSSFTIFSLVLPLFIMAGISF